MAEKLTSRKPISVSLLGVILIPSGIAGFLSTSSTLVHPHGEVAQVGAQLHQFHQRADDGWAND
ncbi:MAG: hypothetical protein ACLR23_06045 [Clostridia bacterium]